jgi:hypothetical protein
VTARAFNRYNSDKMTISEIEAAALNLDTDARAALVEKLLRSLGDLSQEEIDRLWVEEALRRDEELDAGTAKARDADDVFRDALARFS